MPLYGHALPVSSLDSVRDISACPLAFIYCTGAGRITLVIYTGCVRVCACVCAHQTLHFALIESGCKNSCNTIQQVTYLYSTPRHAHTHTHTHTH